MHKAARGIIGIALLSVSFYGCAKDAPVMEETTRELDVSEIAEISEGAEAEMKVEGLGEKQTILSFDMTGYTKDGTKKWEIQGKSADIIADTVVLDDIEANAYSDDRTVALKARSGSYDKKENSVRLEDDVIVTTSDGVELKAEWLKWESKTDDIKTDSFVEVMKDNMYASGRGAHASTQHKEVQLNEDITVRQGEVTIVCGGPLTIDYANDKALFHDRVKVTEPRGELTADRLDIFFDLDTRQIERVVAEGNVELRRGANIAKGQKIEYMLASGEAVLTGNPEITIYSEEDLKNAFTGD